MHQKSTAVQLAELCIENSKLLLQTSMIGSNYNI